MTTCTTSSFSSSANDCEGLADDDATMFALDGPAPDADDTRLRFRPAAAPDVNASFCNGGGGLDDPDPGPARRGLVFLDTVLDTNEASGGPSDDDPCASLSESSDRRRE